MTDPTTDTKTDQTTDTTTDRTADTNGAPDGLPEAHNDKTLQLETAKGMIAEAVKAGTRIDHAIHYAAAWLTHNVTHLFSYKEAAELLAPEEQKTE